MIFVGVGTERFSFDRLVRSIDGAAPGLAGEEVFVQLGHSQYEPQACPWERLLPYPELVARIEQARVPILHGGAGMMLIAARAGKVPIVVPRRHEFAEHVDDHQVQLATRMAELGYVILVDDPSEIGAAIRDYDSRCRATRQQGAREPELARAISGYLSDLV